MITISEPIIQPDNAAAEPAATEIVSGDVQLLSQFAQVFRSAVDGAMDQAGMFRGQALLLCTVIQHDGATQSEIADLLAVQGATITHMLQRLEEAGLVARRRDPADNRLVRVYATPAGQAKEIEVNQQLQILEEAVLNGFSTADRAALRRLIGRMMENMQGEIES